MERIVYYVILIIAVIRNWLKIVYRIVCKMTPKNIIMKNIWYFVYISRKEKQPYVTV